MVVMAASIKPDSVNLSSTADVDLQRRRKESGRKPRAQTDSY